MNVNIFIISVAVIGVPLCIYLSVAMVYYKITKTSSSRRVVFFQRVGCVVGATCFVILAEYVTLRVEGNSEFTIAILLSEFLVSPYITSFMPLIPLIYVMSRVPTKSDLNDALDKLNNKIMGLGARWGTDSEIAFRKGLTDILRESGYTVSKFRKTDHRGEVLSSKGEVEADIIIQNGKTFIVEIKASLNYYDIEYFNRVAQFYETHERKKIDKKIMISPFIHERAHIVAEKLGIELFHNAENVS